MRTIQTPSHHLLTLFDRYGKIKNEQIFIVGKTGSGKTLATGGIVEEFHRNGYIVLVIADPKDELEFAYQMFEPEEKYHLDFLRKIGKKPYAKNVKLWHPFSFNVPNNPNNYLPLINFYTFSLKDLGRKEWGLLAETDWDTDTMRILLQASENITKEDGIYGIMHYIQSAVKGKEVKKIRKANPKNFYLEAPSGTLKEVREISNYLQPFKRDYFLAKDNCPLNIKWNEILTDQKNYHVFISNWIRDEKLKDFLVLALLEGIIRNKNYLKKPIVVVIPEIRRQCPFRPEGHKIFLGRAIKNSLSIMRSSGRGMSSVLDSQVMTDTDENIRTTSNVVLLGELGAEIDKVAKIYNYKREVREQLRKMDSEYSFIMVGNEENPLRILPPASMHGEERYNFFDIYRKKGMKTRRYNDVIDTMKKIYSDEEDKIKEKIKREEKRRKELAEQKKREEEQALKGKIEVEEVKKKAEKKEEQSKLQAMKLCYEMFNDENLDKKERSFRKIGKKFGLNHITVKKYIEGYEKELEEGEEESEN